MPTTDTTTTRWDDFWQCLERKQKAARSHPTFFFYFLSAVVLAGGCGIWVAVFQQSNAETWEWLPVVSALYTYFPALAAASAFELVLTQNSEKSVRALAIAGLITIVLVVALAIGMAPSWKSFAVCVVGYLLSLGLWFLANAENGNLHDLPPPTTATGGDANATPAGTVADFKTH